MSSGFPEGIWKKNSLAPKKDLVPPPTPKRAWYSYPHLGDATIPIFKKVLLVHSGGKQGKEEEERSLLIRAERILFLKRAVVGKAKAKRRVDLSILEWARDSGKERKSQQAGF